MSIAIEEDIGRSLAAGRVRPDLAAWLGLPAERGQMRRRAIRDGLIAAGLLSTAFVLVVIPVVSKSFGYDAFSYWSIDFNELYERATRNLYELGAFRYAPPIAQLFGPLHALPWWLFLWGWFAAMLGALLYLGGRWTLALLALPPVALELEHGNIHLFLAVAIAIGFRWPLAWSFVLLTKVSPGIGLLWFAVRREWRSLAIAVGGTLLVGLASWMVAPQLWTDWVSSLQVSAGQSNDLSLPPPFLVRLPLAALLVIWGARTDRPWTVAVSAMLALPGVWPHGLVVALGAVPFLRQRADAKRAGDPESRSRFISLRELLGREERDPDVAAAPASAVVRPWLAVGLIASSALVAAIAVLVVGDQVRSVLSALSALIVSNGA